jgi:serine/threonine-protein kinase
MEDTTRKLSAVEVRVLSRLLEKAQALPAAELEPWLAALPEAQRALVPRLRERLAQMAQPKADEPPPPPPRLEPVKKVDSRHGERVGPYRLLQELGTAGPGVLWQAERAEGGPRQMVALMLPADAGAAERQLASLPEHAHVARLQYAGIDERGRPFRVMRWVEGVTLLEHAQRRRLSAAQRVQLLLPVCAALQHAHGELVAHGDIRAATLRVDDEGRITLLDWGLGRLLYPASAAADMLALAQVLQQLMAGAHPGPDLKAVLARALHATPSERYATVEALVADLQRVLDHRPVDGPHAHGLHRTRLFVRRNRLPLAGAAVGGVLLALAVTMGVRQFQRGQQQVQRSDQVQAFLQQAVPALAAAAAASDATPDPAILAPQLQRALEQTRIGFAGEPVLRGQVLTELALRFRALGQPEQALAVLREAVALLQSTALASDPALAQARAQLAAQSLQSGTADGAVQARTLAAQVLAQCSGAGCDAAQRVAREVQQQLLKPKP